MTVRHSFGGHALDRLIFDFEPDIDGTGDGAGVGAGADPSPDAGAAAGAAHAGSAPDTGESAASTGATEPAPAWTPEQLAQLRDNPEFRGFIAEEAQAIADARLAQLQQPQPAQPQQQGEPVDLNSYLDPFADNYGQNLAQVLQLQQQQTLAAVQQMLSPIVQAQQQSEDAAGDELLRTAITDSIGDTGLHGGDAAVDRIIADVRNNQFPQLAQVYGQSDRAAEIAIQRAVQAERDYQRQIGEQAVEAFKQTLGGVAGAPGEPGGAAVAAQGAHAVKIGQRVVDRYAPVA